MAPLIENAGCGHWKQYVFSCLLVLHSVVATLTTDSLSGYFDSSMLELIDHHAL